MLDPKPGPPGCGGPLYFLVFTESFHWIACNILGRSRSSVARTSPTLLSEEEPAPEASSFLLTASLGDILRAGVPIVPIAGQHRHFVSRFAPLLLGTFLECGVQPLEFVGGQALARRVISLGKRLSYPVGPCLLYLSAQPCCEEYRSSSG